MYSYLHYHVNISTLNTCMYPIYPLYICKIYIHLVNSTFAHLYMCTFLNLTTTTLTFKKNMYNV